MRKRYADLILMPTQKLASETSEMDISTLEFLHKDADKTYMYYSEQAEKYCNSINEKMVYAEDGVTLVPKYGKSEIMSTEQFQSLMAKIKRCEHIMDHIQSVIDAKQLAYNTDEEGIEILKQIGFITDAGYTGETDSIQEAIEQTKSALEGDIKKLQNPRLDIK